MLAHHPPHSSKAVTGETRGDLGPYTHSKPEAAPSTPTSEETELSSSPAGQASGSTQTVASASVLCSAQWRKCLIFSNLVLLKRTWCQVSMGVDVSTKGFIGHIKTVVFYFSRNCCTMIWNLGVT